MTVALTQESIQFTSHGRMLPQWRAECQREGYLYIKEARLRPDKHLLRRSTTYESPPTMKRLRLVSWPQKPLRQVRGKPQASSMQSHLDSSALSARMLLLLTGRGWRPGQTEKSRITKSSRYIQILRPKEDA
jgi:hypothetical protein